MDQKTLEYMKERVEKGEELQKIIKALKQNIESISTVKVVCFTDGHNTLFFASIGNLTDQMKQAYIDAAEEEIKLLEQEFAEL